MDLNTHGEGDLRVEVRALDDTVRFVGVRHHSPACARAIRRALRAWDPAEVLAEGPSNFERLDLLQSDGVEPPVALFSHVTYPPPDDERDSGLVERPRSRGWYPFFAHSPEWVAIRTAAALDCPVSFCDMTLHGLLQSGEADLADLDAEERDLFESTRATHAALHEALGDRLHARNPDDVWDRLFEHGSTERDLEAFVEEVATMGAILRETSGERTLELGGEHDRERYMAARIREALERRAPDDGPVAVVCGALHVPGLVAVLEGDVAPPEIEPLPEEARTGVHLVPWRFERSSEIGRRAGASAPAWYRARWRRDELEAPPWLEMLSRAARLARSRNLPVSTADLEAAAEMAERLATFREVEAPTRADVLDAIRSCWVRGSEAAGHDRVLHVAREAFRGDRSGDVQTSVADPPLVRDVDERLEALSLTCDGDSREVRLRPVRKERHRERMRGLLRLRYLGVRYGEQLRGPRFLQGENLDRVEQVWRIGWDTASRSALFEAAARGATLREAVAATLRSEIAEAERHAHAAASHLSRAYALGLHDLIPALVDELRTCIESDERLTSVLGAVREIVSLYRYRDVLDTVGDPALRRMLVLAWRRTLWLLDDLGTVDPEEAFDVVAGLRELDRIASLWEAEADETSPASEAERLDPEALYDALEARVESFRDTPGVQGGVCGLLWRSGRMSTETVRRTVRGRFLEGDSTSPGHFLEGWMVIARRAYVDRPALVEAVGRALALPDEEGFRARLPRLRRAHTQLTPGESHRLSETIADLWGGDAAALDRTLSASPDVLDAVGRADRRTREALRPWRLDPVEAIEAPGGDGAGATSEDAEPPSTDDAPAEDAAESIAEILPDDELAVSREELLRRWHLVLGRYADDARLPPLAGSDETIDDVLGFLYDREYEREERQQRGAGGGAASTPSNPGRGGRRSRERGAGRGPSQLRVPEWLDHLETLFPKETRQRVEAEALSRYGLDEMVTDASVLERCEPSMELLEAVLHFKDRMQGDVLEAARRLVEEMVERIRDLLVRELESALRGRIQYGRPTPRGTSASFDPKATIRRNLRHWDADAEQLVIEQPWFRRRMRRYTDWRTVVCVDQSGSMVPSTVHASVLASIFADLPEVDSHLVAFDTSIVDLTEHADDPVETLMSVQLGGGTDIAGAVGYCSELVAHPTKTIFVLVTDLYEGGDRAALIERVRQLADDGVAVHVLTSLNDETGEADFDETLARRLAAVGAEVGAMTPNQLADWLEETLG